MASKLQDLTRHKTFISYHHDDEEEVADFIGEYDHDHDVFISRGIGASMAGDIINSTNGDYIKRRIRELYLGDSTVTLVMVGAETWGRRFVDWEIAASLRDTSTSSRNGLVAVTLPSISEIAGRKPPQRITDNRLPNDEGYARWMKYPKSAASLAKIIDDAYMRRKTHSDIVDNSRSLRLRNAS